ncbi:glucokinase [Cohnella lupini]|uniref:Glucokinase n=1 Tax=Cohnella lupini TaxID=1294267 RepID=A0A3D9IQB5_9BACL|nr:glucokinase [Cohnella lupini]
MGGTKIAAALFDAGGSIINRERMDTAGTKTAEEVVQRMVSMINRVAQGRQIYGVGLASPGAVNSREGIVLNGTNLPEWVDVPLKRWMETSLGTQVKVVNDANAAAWGEYVSGAGKGAENMVYVTFSTGIGAGIVLDGNLLLGTHSFAGELGHTIIDPAGPLCSCGSRGCWETFASGTAIRESALRLMDSRPSLISEIAGASNEAVSAKHVFEALRRDDPVAIEVIGRTIQYMALGLVNVIHTFNPDRIVIGGGVSKAGDLLFAALRARTEELVMEPYRRTFDIVPAGLNDDVGLVGAAALFSRN